jgi:RNA polymerase sigma-70 factor (ECF subfamily)
MEVTSADETLASPGKRTVDLRELFTMHAPYVWSSLRRLGVAAPDLEDLTHDVFVQLQSHLAEYDSARPTRPWLFGFAFRIASQYRRRAHRRHETPIDPNAYQAVDATALPDERLATQQDRQLVLEALEAIDLDRRAVFVLYEIDGTPMDEIARTLGIPLNTAYSRLRVARTEFAAAVKRLRSRRR